jgi:hypothetical protein
VVWRRTEHCAIIGETGSGKTYLENLLLKRRGYVIFFRTKAEDPRNDPMDGDWKRARTVKEIHERHPWWLLEPAYEDQHRQGVLMVHKARTERNWTIAIDELYGCTLPHVDLEDEINWALTQGRSGGITMVCGMQRPVGVTRFALSQSAHTFCFTIEGRDAEDTLYKAVTPRLKEALPRLDWRKHTFAYYNRHDRRLLISEASQIGRFM